jgi:hypothetical protein
MVMSSAGLGPENDSELYEYITGPSSRQGRSPQNMKTANVQLTNSVALVRERTIPTERPPLVGEVSANVCGWRGVTWSVRRIPYGRKCPTVKKIWSWDTEGGPTPRRNGRLVVDRKIEVEVSYDRRSVDQSVQLWISLCGASFLTRGLFLGLARAVTLGFKSRRTHDHILLSHLWLPQPGGPGHARKKKKRMNF